MHYQVHILGPIWVKTNNFVKFPFLVGSQPWIVSIIYDTGSCTNIDRAHNCGGTLINDGGWVLTAAHCFPAANEKEYYRIKAGDYFGKGVESFCNEKNVRSHATNKRQLKRNEQFKLVEDQTEVSISKIILHPSFKRNNDGGVQFDIALVKLSTKIELSKFIQPACLPSRKDQFQKQCCVIAGWGKTENEDIPDILQVSSIPGKSPKVCKRTYSEFNTGKRETVLSNTYTCTKLY